MKLGRESLYSHHPRPGAGRVRRGALLMLSLSDRLWGYTVIVICLAIVFVGIPFTAGAVGYLAWFIHEHYGFAAFFDAMIAHEKFRIGFWAFFGIACLGGVTLFFDR
jgi:hypothetical protein